MTRGRKPLTQHQEQGICLLCNTNKQTPGPVSKNGYRRYLQTCSTCTKKKYKTYIKSYRQNKKPHCERCGFEGHPCQLDVHHIDRDHKNNTNNNLMTLCANCHRLEHHLERVTIWGPN